MADARDSKSRTARREGSTPSSGTKILRIIPGAIMDITEKKANILIIDDEVGIGDILQKILAKEGYNVTATTSGKEGIKYVKKGGVSLVILDIKMAEMDGIEVLEKIHEIDKNIVVIMLTAYATLGTAREAMRLGAYDYITKPFDNEFVKAMVKEGLK